jgi:putative ABC transport system substrate-binding protein
MGGAAAAYPLAARAQQTAMPVIGLLGVGTASLYESRLRVLRRSLAEAGFVEGRSVAIEYRWEESRYDRLPALAADLVRRRVNIIVAVTGTAAQAAKAATRTIPIVFTSAGDPIGSGLVDGLSRPGGNLTGATILGAELGPKRLELLHEAAPQAKVLGALINPTTSSAGRLAANLPGAARLLGVQLREVHASTVRDLETLFGGLTEQGIGGVITTVDALFNGESDRLAQLSLRHSVPMIAYAREFTAAGGLMSYGGNATEMVRIVGAYAARILRGERPADLPVQQVTKYNWSST